MSRKSTRCFWRLHASVKVLDDRELSHVERVADILWPSPAAVVIGRWPSLGRRLDVEEWLVLQSRREPRWLLPARCTECGRALLRHDEGQRNPRALKVLSLLHQAGVLRWAPIRRVRVRGNDQTSLEAALGEIIGERVAVCARLGRRRLRRSLVLQLLNDEGRAVAFAKLAATTEAAEALHVETANLERVAQILPDTLVSSPKVLYSGSWQGHDLLIMSPLRPHGATRQDGDLLIDVMLKTARAVPRPDEQVAAAAYTRRQAISIEALPPGPDVAVLKRAHEFLVTTYGRVTLEVGLWHGDWVPWNMATTDEGLQLWDWEHFTECVPVGWDLVHYLSQRLRIRSGVKRRLEGRWLAESYWSLSRHMGLGRQEISALIISYLIEINIRYLADRTHEPADAPPRELGGLALLNAILSGQMTWDNVTAARSSAVRQKIAGRSGADVPLGRGRGKRGCRPVTGWPLKRAGD